MCVAPDYVLVHASQKEALVKALQQTIEQFFTTDPSTSSSYGRIINEKQFYRLLKYLDHRKVVYGGKYDVATNYMAPTLLTDVDVDTDQVARRVTLKGRVGSAGVRDKVVELAREAAPGYTIDNELTIR